MDFHPDCVSRATEKLTEILSEGMLTSNRFVDLGTFVKITMLDEVFPTTGKVRDQLEEYVGDNPVVTFFIQEILKEADGETTDTVSGEDRKLKSLAPFHDVASASKAIVERFCSLPWKYELSIDLCEKMDSLLKLDPRLEITPNLWIEKRPIPRRVQNLLIQPKLVEREVPSLCSSASGYVTYGQSGGPIFRFKEDLKAFLGLGVALGLLTFAAKQAVPYNKVVTAKRVDGSDEFIATPEVEGDLKELISRVKVSEKLVGDDNVAELEQMTMRVIKCFQMRPRTDRLLAASMWYFDGFGSSNDLLNYVQTIVCLEILLGDKRMSDDVGIGKLLASRCAYLIGRSVKEREEIEKEMQEIYSLRSKIVHNGHSRLDHSQVVMLRQLRSYCKRVIVKETELFYGEKR